MQHLIEAIKRLIAIIVEVNSLQTFGLLQLKFYSWPKKSKRRPSSQTDCLLDKKLAS